MCFSFSFLSCSMLLKRGRIVPSMVRNLEKQKEAAVCRENEEPKQLLTMLDRDVAGVLGCPWDSPIVSFHRAERERNNPRVRLLMDK